MTVGELWIELFEYYALGLNMNEIVVSVRRVGGITREEKQWKGKKLVIEGICSKQMWVLYYLWINCPDFFSLTAHSYFHSPLLRPFFNKALIDKVSEQPDNLGLHQ